MQVKIEFYELQSLVRQKTGREIVLSAVDGRTMRVEAKVKVKVRVKAKAKVKVKAKDRAAPAVRALEVVLVLDLAEQAMDPTTISSLKMVILTTVMSSTNTSTKLTMMPKAMMIRT